MKENKRIILSVLGIIVLMILIVGTTYAGFSKTSSGGNNSISSGTITMTFQEPSNNVVITNAMPISGTNYTSTTHFDFSVSGTAKAAIPIAYEISIRKSREYNKSRLCNDRIKEKWNNSISIWYTSKHVKVIKYKKWIQATNS